MRRLLVPILFLCSVTLLAAPPRRAVGSCSVSARTLPSPRTFTPRVLVIMANFQDYQFVSSKADVDSMFNAVSWTKDDAKGSVRQYFYDQSQGRYNPQFDVIGPVTLPQTYAYYGANSGKNTSPRAGIMIYDACTRVNDSVDFTQYDANGDGKVDLVYVLYAGFGENDPPEYVSSIKSTDLVWPHYSTTNTSACFDGKSLYAYECSNELDGLYSYDPHGTNAPVVSGIGVMVHEYGHSLGLPDMYNTQSQTAFKTLGDWSVMDHGCYNDDMHSPASLTAYERWYLGWLTPDQLTGHADVTLQPLSESADACYFTADNSSISNILSPTQNAFYILENRQQTGWDLGLPSEGLLLYKIQHVSSKWSNNTINTDSAQMGVDILEADGIWRTVQSNSDDFHGKQGDCYPYKCTDDSILNSITVVPALPITQIRQQSDGSIAFIVCGGVESGLQDIPSVASVQKCFYRGQLYIRRGSQLYDVRGQMIK